MANYYYKIWFYEEYNDKQTKHRNIRKSKWYDSIYLIKILMYVLLYSIYIYNFQ